MKKFIKVKCSIINCPYFNQCPKIPCEIINENKTVDILLIGEAPAKKEVEFNRPFFGLCGQLLRNTLSYLSIYNNYAFSNICRFWPKNEKEKTRTPTLEEINRCIINLKKDIKILKPKKIIALGNIAVHGLKPNANIISEERKFIETIKIENQTYLFAKTYHPSHIKHKMSLLTTFQQDLKRAFDY